MIENLQKIIIKIKNLRQVFYSYYSSKVEYFKEVLEIIQLENGSQPPKEKHIYSIKDGYLRFVQNRDYSTDSHLTYIPISKNNHICDENDIMMDKYGDAGKVRYGISGAYNVALLKIKPKKYYHREYIRDFFLQTSIKNILYNSSQASTRPSLNESTFIGLKIPIISENEMKKYQDNLTGILELEHLISKKIGNLENVKKILLEKYY